MNHLISITKSDGTTELFEEEKLVNSLRRSGASPEVIDEIINEVEKEMWNGMKTEDIYHRAFGLLKHRSHSVAIKYSTRRAIFELGPDGFPFEKFVARIFNFWGYEAVTDQTVGGACVEHEVDVVAWKDKELAMVEAKFHNEFGLKSDLKVVLYVKARFDDVADNFYDYGGMKRKLTSRWLFTNTKFSDMAIKYGECKDIKLIGWNYPNSLSLHEIIDQNCLHPVTSIMSLSHQEKKDLIGRNALLCVDIIKNPDILHEIGVKTDIVSKVIEEANMVCGGNSKIL
ncbi:MAG: ATP cone domain-containing protein [Candidatus Paceibacterota bacterium]|jgi:hypothetical protein